MHTCQRCGYGPSDTRTAVAYLQNLQRRWRDGGLVSRFGGLGGLDEPADTTITLRDRFAERAMHAITTGANPYTAEEIALSSYVLADAMLQARAT